MLHVPASRPANGDAPAPSPPLSAIVYLFFVNPPPPKYLINQPTPTCPTNGGLCIALLVGQGQMGILGRVFEWGSVCVGSNGFRGQRVGAGWAALAGWGGVGDWVEKTDRDPARKLKARHRRRRRRRCRPPSPLHLPSSDVHGSRYSSSTSHLHLLRITPSSSSTTHSLPSSSCKMLRSLGEVL